MFPEEIIELILYQLLSTKSALSPTLSVSRLFHDAALRLLLRHIKIVYHPRRSGRHRRQLSLLLEILDTYSNLVNSIQRVSIMFCLTEAVDHRHDVVESATDLTEILDKLLRTPLTSLQIWGMRDPTCRQGRGPRVEALLIPTLPINIIQSLVALRCKPSLRHLALENIDSEGIPPLLIVGVPNADQLSTVRLKLGLRFTQGPLDAADFLSPFVSESDNPWPSFLYDNAELAPYLKSSPFPQNYTPFAHLTSLDLAGSFKLFINFLNKKATVQGVLRNPNMDIIFPRLKTFWIQIPMTPVSSSAFAMEQYVINLMLKRTPALEMVAFVPETNGSGLSSDPTASIPSPALIRTLTRGPKTLSTIQFSLHSNAYNTSISALADSLSSCLPSPPAPAGATAAVVSTTPGPSKPYIPSFVRTIIINCMWVLGNSTGLFGEVGAAGVLGYQNQWHKLGNALRRAVGAEDQGLDYGLELEKVELHLRIRIRQDRKSAQGNAGVDGGIATDSRINMEVFRKAANELVGKMKVEGRLDVVHRLNVDMLDSD